MTFSSPFRLFSYGEFKAEDQQKMLDSLNKKVEEVYRSCIGDNEANIRLVDYLLPWQRSTTLPLVRFIQSMHHILLGEFVTNDSLMIYGIG